MAGTRYPAVTRESIDELRKIRAEVFQKIGPGDLRALERCARLDDILWAYDLADPDPVEIRDAREWAARTLEVFSIGGSSGQREADAPTHKTPPEGAQRLATTNTAGANVDGGTPAGRPCPGPSFSDPGDGYDSAIRWHADFERGGL